MKIGIKFCGGCNPVIDRGLLARRVLKELLNSGYLIEVEYETEQMADCEAIIIINGCQVGCVKEICSNTVNVGGNEFNYTILAEDQLPAAIVKEIIENTSGV